MPELPEVETTVRGLASVLDGARILRVETRRADLRVPFPPDLVQGLTGARVTGLGRRAKYGLIHTDRGRTMIFHLGMSGRWRIDPDAIGPHDHLLLETPAHRLALNDPRRFGFVALADTQALDAWPAFAAMGPEPLGEPAGAGAGAGALSPAHLAAAFAARKTAVKLLLLDQRVVAGLGNIYVCEALHGARIDPRKPAGRVGRAALARLVPAIRSVLEAAIAQGGSSLRDYARPDGQLGYFAHHFAVYGREGAACPRADGGTVQRIAQGGRSTWYCPKCQR
ncbi:MAG: bifunctional DNA-formamidopyrimidine glycosylase/DNA-(apurinic or apyrimidinic site) lyase [Porphyrobacter sp.]|nr:bifunctional DNA-formamidopyrimidine glycosylase/DNA-(apurinic or apyrimidinic site) lyase [Porphyrobacter sp.]